MEKNKIYLGNNIDILKTFEDNSIDSIVTDPPYGLGKEPNAEEVLKDWLEHGYHEIKGKGFMGKEWDAFVPQPILWKECLRVLKPGGHLLSFAGTRTYDWIVMGLRLSGFEIRDQIAWIYGSGFPKSHDISKAIDKMMGAEREIIGKRKGSGTTGLNSVGNQQFVAKNDNEDGTLNITAPSTDEAKQWQGWGTALKPSQETVCVARKPIENSSVILYNDIKEVALCLLKSFVIIVEKSFTLSQQEQNVVQDIVRWIAEKNISIEVDLQEVMVMLQSLKMANMNLNIVLSWLNTLAEIYTLKNTSITETVLSMIIELKILKSLEWENILQNITQVKNNKTSGTQQNVSHVEKTFSDLKMKLDYIQTHFVQENATSLGRSKNLSSNLEPIVMARKPIEGTIASNVLKYGTGGLNIDGCRVGTNGEVDNRENKEYEPTKRKENGVIFNSKNNEDFSSTEYGFHKQGRFPANVIHDGSDEVVELFPNTNPSSSGGISSGRNFGQNYDDGSIKKLQRTGHDDNGGSASRFFYTAKASQSERNFGLYGFEDDVVTDGRTKPIDNAYNRGETKRKNIHPTVKPIDLMRYLVRLVTPKGGICLDPFMGSGTTAIACKSEKLDYIGCEIDEQYHAIAEARVKAEVVKYDIFDFMED